MRLKLAFLSLLIGLTAIPVAAAPVKSSSLGEGCHLSGFSDPLRCIKIPVPLDYADPNGAKTEIFVTIAPSFREFAKPDPVFVLAGGPGQAGSDLVMMLEHAMKKMRATRDIIFIDQRGTGKSGKLDCEAMKEENLSFSLGESLQVFKSCVDGLGVNLSHYSTANAARDLDAVRAALGYSTINVWGGSYGTRLAQTYARLFPGTTRSLMLDGVASPEQILGVWSKDAQASFEKMLSACESDVDCQEAFPELRTQFAGLRQSVKQGVKNVALSHPRTGEDLNLPIEYDTFADTIRTALYSPSGMAAMPLQLQQAAEGNFKPFVTAMLTYREWSRSSMAVVLTFAVACAEDLPYLNQEIIEQDIAAGFLEGVHVRLWPQLCKQLSVEKQTPHATDKIEAPVLLLSGEFDPVTPPWRAEQAMQHMSRTQHIVVPNLSHGISNAPCAAKLLRQFVDEPNKEIDAQCLKDIRFPPFMVGPAGPRP